MEVFEMLKDKVMTDESNLAYTQAGIEPLYQASAEAKLLIVGQAPGIRAQTAGRCWADPSGDRLRTWLGLDESCFYSPAVAILPMDFYYPGKAKTGDQPPRRDFANSWHPQFIEQMPQLELTILAGRYAQDYYLRGVKQRNLTETVRHYEDYLPDYWPIVHPSPLNGRWLKQNPWFQADVVPELQARVQQLFAE